MNKSTVALIRCNNYDEELVYNKVKKGIELIGGLSAVIGKDEKVLVKPNLLVGAEPSKAITTHPSVLGAVFRCLKDEGYADVSYGDSNGKPVSSIAKEMAVSMLDVPAAQYGVPLADFQSSVKVENPSGSVAKKFVLAKAVCDADAIISVCKMKTHALERITGAVKNQYGCIYAGNKAVGHAHYPNADVFAKQLVDLNMYIKPRLFIMDGILAMEGNGPASGTPVMMNTILVSTDPVALDTVFASLVNLDPMSVPTNFYGEKMGLGNAKPENITVLSEDGEIPLANVLESFGKADFDVNREKKKLRLMNMLFKRSAKPKHKPVVDLNKCIGCGICEKACPVTGKAVHSGGGKKAEYDYSKCIRCYCCQEMCPEKAISRAEE